jgi:glycosyltransferase involved in cell wall biosynthesis
VGDIIFPIAVRTRNRPVYCDVTLKSLAATKLPDGLAPIVIDDCSDNEIARAYVDTDGVIELPEIHTWPDAPKWIRHVGQIAPVKNLKGIKGRYEQMNPRKRKGVRGCLFWGIDNLFQRFPDSEGVIMIEGDCVFHEDWYLATVKGWTEHRNDKGPNGEGIGLLSCYDRKSKNPKGDMGFAWRSLRILSSGRWNCGNGIGGVMYLVTRPFYELVIKAMQKSYPPGSRGGDTMIQGYCANSKKSIAVTSPSYCQHIGIESTAWPQKGWRYTSGFKKPFAFEAFDDEGVAYSPDWMD